MTLILAYKDRGLTRDLQINKADGTILVLTANDKLRIIIGHEGKLGTNLADAELTFVSGSPTVNGSSITKNSPSDGLNRMRLDASDLLLIPAGVYTLYFDHFDNADAGEWKNISRQVFSLEET